METHDLVIVGGGQMGLSLGYYLNRTKADFLLLDAEDGPGGAWRHGWESLRLFSPADYSSLPGWLMPPPSYKGYPTRDNVLDYLVCSEERYRLPIRRPVQVTKVDRAETHLPVRTDEGNFAARHAVSATGTWCKPYIPNFPGHELFKGHQIHAAHDERPDVFAGQTVLVVGGGNSGRKSWPKSRLSPARCGLRSRSPCSCLTRSTAVSCLNAPLRG